MKDGKNGSTTYTNDLAQPEGSVPALQTQANVVGIFAAVVGTKPKVLPDGRKSCCSFLSFDRARAARCGEWRAISVPVNISCLEQRLPCRDVNVSYNYKACTTISLQPYSAPAL